MALYHFEGPCTNTRKLEPEVSRALAGGRAAATPTSAPCGEGSQGTDTETGGEGVEPSEGEERAWVETL